MAKTEQPLGDVGTTMLFENDRVRVWNLVLGPGEASPLHKHPLDYLTIVIEGTNLRVVFENGQFEDRSYRIGDVNFRPKHSTHYVSNTGSVRYKNLIIELKE